MKHEGETWELRPDNSDQREVVDGEDTLIYECSDIQWLNQARCEWEGETWAEFALTADNCVSTASWWNIVGKSVDGVKCLLGEFQEFMGELSQSANFSLTCDNVNVLNVVLKLPACLLLPDPDEFFEDLEQLGTEIGNQLGPFGEPIHYFTSTATFPGRIQNCGTDDFTSSTDDDILWIGGKITLDSDRGRCRLVYSNPGHTAPAGQPGGSIVNAVNSGSVIRVDVAEGVDRVKSAVGNDFFVGLQRVLAVALALFIAWRVFGEVL